MSIGCSAWAAVAHLTRGQRCDYAGRSVRRPNGYLGSLDRHRRRAPMREAVIAEREKFLGRVAPFGEAPGGAAAGVLPALR